MKLDSISSYLAILGGAYAALHATVIAVIKIARVFTRVEEAHSRIDNHKKEIESYISRIDARIAEIQREIKEMYQILVVKAQA